MTTSEEYRAFLEGKVKLASLEGFEVDPAEINPDLKDFVRAIVAWAARGGRRGIFSAFGLHKTSTQIELARLAMKHRRAAPLIVLPLGVRQEFFDEAEMRFRGDHAVRLRFIRTNAEADENAINLTNYESVREGKIDPSAFGFASLDEAAVLRSYGSKTFQEFLPKFADVPLRYVATATPSPNRLKELIHYSGFLGIMDTGQALTRFFQRDSQKANELTLYPHKEEEFWLWVHSWAVFLQKPSDLGFSDEGYILPKVTVTWHEVATDHAAAAAERDGQGVLFKNAAVGVSQAAAVKRESLPARIAKMQELIAEAPEAHRILWHDLEAEREAIEEALPIATYGKWEEYRDGNLRALALYERHYSARPDRDSRLIVGPGEKMVLLTAKADALFVWRKFIDDSGQQGINCAVFRNEGPLLSSDLISEAMAIAWKRWPGERLYTYVNATKIRSDHPGYCFIKAGWRRCGMTKGGLVVLEATADTPVPAVERHDVMRSIFGSQELEQNERNAIDFKYGRFRDLATKPEMSGAGCNFQGYCWWSIFVGVTPKFHDFIQAVHRTVRFGQSHECRIDIIYSEAERSTRRILERKWGEHDAMVARMQEIIRRYGLNHIDAHDILKRTIGVERVEVTGERFVIANNDCVDEARRQRDNHVGLIVTSIPFANHYEYTASYNDFGHTDDNAHFWAQMDFLTPELLRILKPGRLACIHVKDRILFGSVTGAGAPTVSPFHAEAIMHYRRHGFDFMGMVTVVTDVVRENNQTYRLGWSEQCKDGTKMGVGSPEYVLLMRKPQSDRSKGYADEPVVKSKSDYSRARWQADAHAFWRSSGERHLTAEEMASYGPAKLAKVFSAYSLENVYDFATHVRIGEELDARGALPSTFMSLAPGSHHPDVWHDVNRMRTLNGEQATRNVEKHICPLQFDIVDRLIERYSNRDDIVYDPFGGLMTVPVRALKLGRRGQASELSAEYFRDGVHYLQAAERELSMPTLFGFEEAV